jgi:putative endonuclease
LSRETRKRAEAVGRRAETLAALYLRLTGHRILARRFRSSSGEVDLVARRGQTLVFAEVKHRAGDDPAPEPVSARSEERIVRTAETFLSRHPRHVKEGCALRFDIIVVRPRLRMEHRRDVFRGW